ncbi:MAG: hypothetical protein HYX25_05580 [Candidatus Solibacter usitatus]|nr:hypothetical protein [Candidatus Solibacter usitatus]
MYRRFVVASAAFAMIAGSLCAQIEVSERQAYLRGDGNPEEGRCTVEVIVDGAAEVEIRGDIAVLRTLRGQPAQWRSFECNGYLPRNPANFRFMGVDGRGRQDLIREPRDGGFAVVHIEDSRGGAEGYRFDITWNGRMGPPPRAYRERRVDTEEAIKICVDNIRHQGVERFHVPVVDFRNTRLDDNPGRNDWVIGELEVHPGGRPAEVHRFSCSIDLTTGVLRSATIQGAPPPMPNRAALSPNNPAIPACAAMVQKRLQREGYRRVSVGQIQADNRPGTDDWIGGVATARRRGQEDRFEFSCSVDLRRGTVRSVDLRPR